MRKQMGWGDMQGLDEEKEAKEKGSKERRK